MRRPRWHDVVLGTGLLAVLVTGILVFWGNDLRVYLGWKPATPAADMAPAAATPGAT